VTVVNELEVNSTPYVDYLQTEPNKPMSK